MLDPAMRRIIDRPLDLAGRWLALAGLSANVVTLCGFIVGVGAAVALTHQRYGLALTLILLNRIADGLDGAIARHAGITDLGGYLDVVLDFLFYSGVVFGFAVGRPDQALAAAFLIFSFVGTGSAFLAYAVIAAKRALTTQIRGRKSLYYIGGLAEGTETIVAFVLLCLFPDWFPWIAYGFGALCWLTTLARIAAAIHEFGD